MVICLARPDPRPHGMSETGGCGVHCGRRAAFRVRPAIGLPTAPGAAAGRDGRAIAQGRRREGLDRSGQRRYRRGLQRLYPEFRFWRARGGGARAGRRPQRAGPQAGGREGLGGCSARRYRCGLQQLHPEFRLRCARGGGPPAHHRPQRTGPQGRGRKGLGGCRRAPAPWRRSIPICRTSVPARMSPRPVQRIAALDEQARKDADEKAWTDAQRTGTAAAFNGYIQNFSSGAHVAEARQRATTLEAQARKDADDKAWADAQKRRHLFGIQYVSAELRHRRVCRRCASARRHDRCARAQGGAHRRHSENLPGRRRRDGQPVGREHDRSGRQGVPGLRSKRPASRSSRTGRLIRRSTNRDACGRTFISRAMWNGSPASRWKETFARCRWGNRARRRPRRCRRCARPSIGERAPRATSRAAAFLCGSRR